MGIFDQMAVDGTTFVSVRLSSLVLYGVTLPQKKGNSLGVLRGSWLLLKEQMAIVASLLNFLLCASYPSLRHSCPGHALLDYYNVFYLGLPLKTILNLQLGQNTAVRAIFGAPKMVHGTLSYANHFGFWFASVSNSRCWL